MYRTFRRIGLLFLSLVLHQTTARAQRADSLLMRPLAMRSIGPAAMSGRIVDLSVAEAPKMTRGGRLGTVMYVAVATGGIWKTTNGGIAWTPVSDSIRIGSIGAVAAAPSNGDVVWVGTGEANNMRSSSWGAGVFKSTDGGRTWSKPMLPKTQHIGRIVIDPRDPNVVYVAAVGPLWAPGGDRGVFKTVDGGTTWSNTKNLGPQTGFSELVIDPANPDVLYAAALQRERREYGFLPGGTESAIWKTIDGAKTWTKLAGGLPTGELGRIGLSVCRSRSSTIYATVHAKGTANGLYRSDDAGGTWRNVNMSNGTAWYYSQVRCDPTDAEHVYRLNANSQESYDGGKTWMPFANNGGVHGDAHALWINPEAPEHIVLGNDGGLDISYDRGRSWYNVENIVGAQFYAIAVDDAQPFYNVFGGLQDNQTWGGPSRTRTTFGPSNADWYRMHGGDGFYNVPDPTDRNLVYAEMQSGGIVRYDTRTGQAKNIKPIPKNGEKYRYNWSAPIVPSHHAARTVYFAANYLFKSTDRGDSWNTISPDLTRAIDRKELPMRGVKPDTGTLGLHEGTAEFSNISTVSESPLRAGLLAVGTDDGNVQVTRDDGKSWVKSTTFPGVPDTTFVSRVVFSSHAEGTLYATMDGHRSNDFKAYVQKSTDFGKTWASIVGDLPDGGSVQVIREHFRQPNLLFVGTEFGVYCTIDGGAHWTQLKSGIPGVPVWDLQIQERWNDLVVGTHGRGIYILDDLAPLEHLAEAKQAAVAYLVAPRSEIAMQLNASRNSGMGSTGFTGQNPDHGVRIAFMLNTLGADSKARLEIVNATGTVIRELPVVAQPGLYRLVWDMRAGAPLTGPSDTTQGVARSPRVGLSGPMAAPTYAMPPGAYVARLTITPHDGVPTVLTQRFNLLKDPQQIMTDGELRTLDQFRVHVVQFQRALAESQLKTDSVMRRFADIKRAATANATKISDDTRRQIATIEKALVTVVRDIGAPAAVRAAQLTARIASATGATPPLTNTPVPAIDDDAAAAASPGLTLQARAATLTEMLGVSFAVTPAQQMLVQSLPLALAAQRSRVTKIERDEIASVRSVLQAAGVDMSSIPASAPTPRGR